MHIYAGADVLNFEWYFLYLILGVLVYIYILKTYLNNLSIKNKLSNKVLIKKEKFLWGEEEIWGNNEKYIAKNIFLKKRSVFAKIYHKKTIKTIFIVSGDLHLYAEKLDISHDIILHPGDAYEIYPETKYFISAINDVRYIEISNQSTNDNYSCKKEIYDRQRYRNWTRKYD